MCQEDDEDIDHLFFDCSFSASVWTKLLAWQGIHRHVLKWNEEVQWAITHMKGRNSVVQVYRMTLVGTIYCLWMECNCRIFQNKQTSEERIIRRIIRDVHGRGSQHARLSGRLQQLNVYP
ncbi:hypothetical protein MTR67_026982 [Solanum verrucosum]|uniref:Reverse transcriptase zinc-binding domain-containing protein n=1 Tax=Solanum verrucosum TaxID=315347 RepID=A0AAF0QZZ0_SOLVR|nr:hypothetical protein MTR67_026982 [Solanum verrucosum]